VKENRLRFDKVTAMSLVVQIFGTQCSIVFCVCFLFCII